MKALVIDEPWISLILKGSKTWEMRSRKTATRGQIALIRKGSGTVVGVARLTGCRGPLGLQELQAQANKHCVPMERFRSGQASQWTTAWELADVRPLKKAVPYKHPLGAVVWVNLDPGTATAIAAQIENRGVNILAPPKRQDAYVDDFRVDALMRVPVAKDGTWFGPHLLRAGQFTIGEKGGEARVDSFIEALDILRRMDSPRWRRPNGSGNWGIVTGVNWVQMQELPGEARREIG